MNRRRWLVFAVFVALDALDFTLTIRDHFTFRRVRGSVTVMPVGQLLGWASSVALFLALTAVVITVIRGELARSRARYRPPP
jgi:hypothetical protein